MRHTIRRAVSTGLRGILRLLAPLDALQLAIREGYRWWALKDLPPWHPDVPENVIKKSELYHQRRNIYEDPLHRRRR